MEHFIAHIGQKGWREMVNERMPIARYNKMFDVLRNYYCDEDIKNFAAMAVETHRIPVGNTRQQGGGNFARSKTSPPRQGG